MQQPAARHNCGVRVRIRHLRGVKWRNVFRFLNFVLLPVLVSKVNFSGAHTAIFPAVHLRSSAVQSPFQITLMIVFSGSVSK